MTIHMIEHALAYTEAGFRVLPLRPRSKVPACPHGKDDASADPHVAAAWWNETCDANIAIRPPADMLVLDVDVRNGGDLKQLGPLTPTWCAATGGGGWHLWYRHRLTRLRGTVAGTKGIDVKSSSGYLVAPPSVHPNGQRYRWVNQRPIAWLPRHLHDRVSYPAEPIRRPAVAYAGEHSGSGLVEAVQNAPQGNRHKALCWAAKRAADESAPDEVFAELAAAAAGNGLDAREIEQAISWARNTSRGVLQ